MSMVTNNRQLPRMVHDGEAGVSDAELRSAAASPAGERLASTTTRAIEQMGEAAAMELDAEADRIRRAADEIACRIEETAKAIRQRGRAHAEEAAKFLTGAVKFMEGIDGLQERIKQGMQQ